MKRWPCGSLDGIRWMDLVELCGRYCIGFVRSHMDNMIYVTAQGSGPCACLFNIIQVFGRRLRGGG
jgi:hypothetical protein